MTRAEMVHTTVQLIRAVFNLHLDGDMSTCQYFQGKGTCTYGCHEEPSCITDAPIGGWPSRRNLYGRINWVLRGEGER